MRYIDWLKQFDREKQIDIINNYLKSHPKETYLYRYLAHQYALKKDFTSAINILENACLNNPDNLWLKLELSDLFQFEIGDVKRAKQILKESLSRFEKPVRSTLSPYRYILKRLTLILYEEGNFEEALTYYNAFYSIEPSDFYASDFLRYAQLLLNFNHVEEAKNVILVGIKTHPKNKELKEFLEKNFKIVVDTEDRVVNFPDFQKIPIKTPLIKEDDDILEVIKTYALPYLKRGDIITISSCVLAISEGRIYPLDAIRLTPMAKVVSRFINQESVPFGGAAPLANPYAMQIAIEEVGVPRIIFGVFMGAIGKLLGIDGWFYKFAGEQTALIDDPPGAIPPYDYYVIPGPKDSNKSAKKIKDAFGFETAIIDANELGRAWVVGATEGVDRKLLERILSDNPAGNEDESTPIVIVRRLK